jgi:hypothetical protein
MSQVMTDFQGHVFDDSGSISSDHNPVIGFPINVSTRLNQQASNDLI